MTHSIFESPDEIEPIERAYEEVLEKYHRELTERRIERFFWLFAIVTLINVVASVATGWTSILHYLLSIILLIGCAKWLEVHWVVGPLEQLQAHMMRRWDRQTEDS